MHAHQAHVHGVADGAERGFESMMYPTLVANAVSAGNHRRRGADLFVGETLSRLMCRRLGTRRQGSMELRMR